MTRNYLTIEECSRMCGISRRAFYMHVYRGHLQVIKMLSHKLFVDRRVLLEFMDRYGYTIIEEYDNGER